MIKKREYRSAIRSKKLIRQAFADLMENRSIDSIKVTEIVEKAGISRATFYAHFSDANAVINQLENEIIEKLNDLLSGLKYHKFVEDSISILYKIEGYIEEDLELFSKLIKSSSSDRFINELKQMALNKLFLQSEIPEEILKNKEFLISINFIAGGMVNLYTSWIKKEIDCTLREITHEVYKHIQLFHETLINKTEVN